MNATKTIFVIDDEPSVRKSLGRLLRAAGYRVDTFASAGDFLASDPSAGIGCLVLDLQMPELDGLELQQALRRVGRDMPIIFISGHGSIPASVQAMKAGALDFLSKPFLEDDLLRAVADALEKAERMSKETAVADEFKRRIALLTPREHEVLLQVITGRLNKQIAAGLGTA